MTDEADRPPRPHRPARYADLTELIDAAGGSTARPSAEVAAETARELLRAGRRSGETARFVALADLIGLDTLAALWRDADPASLPGALWALYLLRQWCYHQPDEVSRLWRDGEPLAPAEAAVAGVADHPGTTAVGAFADAVLAGVYRGEFDVALERAAAFFRVIAVGRRVATAPADATECDSEFKVFADRNERVSDALAVAAQRWRAGSLH